ncbi:MAG: carboxymuconolactone decarboxylase family protein [Bacteriovorax sp.]
MKFKITILALTIFSITVFTNTTSAAMMTSTNPELQATYNDIQKTFGFVPSFLKAYPENGLTAAWQEMKSIQLNSNTVLSGRVKELIGLGIAAQIPCKYCVYFHTEAAKLNGASEGEIKEAIAMAAETRHWSTFLNGLQYSEADMQRETDQIMAFIKKGMSSTPTTMTSEEMAAKKAQEIEVTNPQTAYQDIEKTLGSVPGFLKMYPEEGIVGAWKLMKTVHLNPETELSAKAKELIGLGVSAQLPCKLCTYFHTEAAKVNGASTEEIRETIAMASITRFWSTVINGSQINEDVFKREVRQIMKNVKSQEAKRVGMTKITSAPE